VHVAVLDTSPLSQKQFLTGDVVVVVVVGVVVVVVVDVVVVVGFSLQYEFLSDSPNSFIKISPYSI
jgi:hypothetical protein